MRLIDADMFEKELEEELLPALIEKYGEAEANNGLHLEDRMGFKTRLGTIKELVSKGCFRKVER